MARNPSISLTEHQQDFVYRMIESGRYHGVSEIVRAGLRLLEEREESRQVALRALEAAIEEGFESGPSEPLESMDEIVEAAKSEGG